MQKLIYTILSLFSVTFHLTVFYCPNLVLLLPFFLCFLRNSGGSCGKVMFSQVSVCPRGQGVGYLWQHVPSWSLVPCPFQGIEHLLFHVSSRGLRGGVSLVLCLLRVGVGYLGGRVSREVGYPGGQGIPTPLDTIQWIAIQWKHSHLFGTKQPKFTESSTPKIIFSMLILQM